MLKAIIFDCFGVLTTDSWRQFLDNLPKDADITAARKAHRAYNAGLLSKQECSNQIKAATGRNFIEVEDAVAESMTKNTKLLAYIHELKTRGFKTGILSNIGSNWIRDQFLSSEEQADIDDFVFSYEVGMVKPDERMYNLASERLGVERSETLFIDDKEPYCQAARTAGLETVCYEDFSQTRDEIERLISANSKS